MHHTPHVALIIETSSGYGRQLLRGISDYMKSHHPWSVFLNQRDLFALPPKWLADWDGDGVICRARTSEAAHVLKNSPVPVVDVSDIDTVGNMPRIESDNFKIGQMAAEHLLHRGFHQFGFCGFQGHTWSVNRQAGFESIINDAGFDCAIYQSTWKAGPQKGWEAEQKRLTQWLQQLNRPVGIMACNDMRGQQVLDACGRAAIAVPESAAVIGCDNDAIYCNLCTPPLSSVMPNPVRIGYEAAALLDEMMHNSTKGAKATKQTTPKVRLIEPIDVATRQSTDVLAIEDELVARSLNYIRKYACNGATVETMLDKLIVSRTTLERRFRKQLGRSPHAEIRSVQLKRVKELLAETDLPLDRIAELAGFTHPEYMSVVFKRDLGQTPGSYRKDVRTTPIPRTPTPPTPILPSAR